MVGTEKYKCEGECGQAHPGTEYYWRPLADPQKFHREKICRTCRNARAQKLRNKWTPEQREHRNEIARNSWRRQHAKNPKLKKKPRALDISEPEEDGAIDIWMIWDEEKPEKLEVFVNG